MGLLVLRPGLFTTVQDRGRAGYRAFGVPPGGAFDAESSDLANAMLDNPPDAATLEFTLFGGTFEALGPVALALAGAPMAATLETADGHKTLSPPVCFALSRGDRLSIGGASRGARSYLAVLGGWKTEPVVLGSRSGEEPIGLGVVLPCDPGRTPVRRLGPSLDPFATADGSSPLRVIDGPDAGTSGIGWLEDVPAYRVGTQCDRMGLRLDGPRREIEVDPERTSTPVSPGAVQVAGGRPMILGIACGTMGGYPHVAQVITADLGRLAQARPGDPVRFARVTLAEARRLDREARTARDARRRRVASAAADGIDGPRLSLPDTR